MSKFCLQCGRQLDDEATHCTYCGAPQIMNNGFTPIQPPADAVPKKSRMGLIILGMAAMAVAGIVTAVLLYFFVFTDDSEKSEKNTYETPIEYYFKFMVSGDEDDLKYVYPDYIIGTKVYNEIVDINNATRKEYGIKEITYTIIDKDELTDDEANRITEGTKKKYDADIDIEEGYKIEIKVNTDTKKDGMETAKIYFYNCKLDGKWYNLDISDTFR